MNQIIHKKKFDAAIDWINNSIDVHGGRGSSAYFQPLRGWAPAYPETTGYLIPTILTIGQEYTKESLINRALSCADWLCTIQKENGHFPAGVGGTLPSNVFDTGQILLGLTAVYKYIGCDHYYEALEKACQRLLTLLDKDASWQKDGYVKGYSPAYYTRVVWALLDANIVLELPKIKEKLTFTLDHYADQLSDNLSFQNWSFATGEPAFTHTIAYTIRGFLESGILLNESRFINLAQKISDRIIKLMEQNGNLAGSYESNWQGDHHFICVPGHFQMVIIFNRLFELTEDEKYRHWAEKLFLVGQKTQSLLPVKGMKGGFPGSWPIWGKYQRFKWLNWGAKFYLDAAQSF
jgi:hypothetical protein